MQVTLSKHTGNCRPMFKQPAAKFAATRLNLCSQPPSDLISRLNMTRESTSGSPRLGAGSNWRKLLRMLSLTSMMAAMLPAAQENLSYDSSGASLWVHLRWFWWSGARVSLWSS